MDKVSKKKNLETKDNSTESLSSNKLIEVKIETSDKVDNAGSVPEQKTDSLSSTKTANPIEVKKEFNSTEAPKEVIESKPIQKNKSFSGFSIKQTLEKKQELAEEEERKDKDPFTYESLMEKWLEYATKANDKNKKTLHTALTTNSPELKEGFTIEHVLDNKTLFDNFNREKQTFLDFLKKELNNYSIQLQAKLIKNEKAEVFLYTDKEKFLKLAETKPELLYLKDKLHLDFEF